MVWEGGVIGFQFTRIIEKVVTISLDMKPGGSIHSDEVFVNQLDALLEETLGKDNIFKPSDLKQANKTLLEGARAGWPSLWDLRGKFIVCITGADSHPDVRRRRKFYSLHGSMAFVDLDQRIEGIDVTQLGYAEGGVDFFLHSMLSLS